MSRIVFLLSLVGIIIMSSCMKSTTTKACFELSKDKLKVGDTLYLLNCSENFKKFMLVLDGGVIDSIREDTKLITTQTGTFETKLYVGPYEFTSQDFSKAKSTTKSYTVE